MTQDNNDIKELIKSMMDVREWLVRLDTKLDGMDEIKKTAHEAKDKAEDAHVLARQNEEQIKSIKNGNWKQWMLFISVAGIIISLMKVMS